LATASPTATPTPAPVIGLMTGNVWLRAGPSADSPRPGVVLELGQQVEILALFGDWYWVRWTSQVGAEVTGWVPVKWVGTVSPIPSRIVTPTASP
jgi:SH3-like domain-containing protein